MWSVAGDADAKVSAFVKCDLLGRAVVCLGLLYG